MPNASLDTLGESVSRNPVFLKIAKNLVEQMKAVGVSSIDAVDIIKFALSTAYERGEFE